LLGEESLLKSDVKLTLKTLIERRGYVVSEDKGDYVINVSYESSTFLSQSSSFGAAEYNSLVSAQVTSSAVAQGYGLGVSLARSMSVLTSGNASAVNMVAETRRSYCHTITLEMDNGMGQQIWKGESTWDTNDPDIRSDLSFAFQLLLSRLPRDEQLTPRVKKVASGKGENYYNLFCNDRTFHCPALPNPIEFVSPADSYNRKLEFSSIARRIENQEAFEAYIDLIRTAEYALPTGSKDYANPLEPDLWSSTTLGGRYYLGSDKEPVFVLIRLTGEKTGYVVNQCWVANDHDMWAFAGEFERWKEALRNYYNVYQDRGADSLRHTSNGK
jgi:hypothetical protein